MDAPLNTEKPLHSPHSSSHSHSQISSAQINSGALHILEEIQSLQNRSIISSLRMAHVHQWQGNFDLSTRLYQECVHQVENLGEPRLLAFALHHQGKNFFDQKKYDAALKCFYESFSISLQNNDAQLMEDSRYALQKTLEQKIPHASQQIINKIFDSLISVIK